MIFSPMKSNPLVKRNEEFMGEDRYGLSVNKCQLFFSQGNRLNPFYPHRYHFGFKMAHII